ncbi:MAG: 4Fe-4S dicluster domain-containing protein [Eggerthellaceae bacterium]|nr:4Fe-4S dicluster domain-containing protein [Eggerthellaceae bacterium]
MAIDKARCSGCNACSMTCKVENNVPDTVWWSRAVSVGGDYRYTPAGEYPHGLSMSFYTLACQHCGKPACVAVCPVDGATYRREDGIVMQDPELCIACRLCMQACPYDVRSYVNGEPQYTLGFAVGDADVREHPGNSIEKCSFCYHRIDRGERPACVDICPAQARHFGDLDDPQSTLSQVLASRSFHQLLTERGTNPSVYLLD